MTNGVTLEDKYALESGLAYMTGIQALVRLPMLQHQRDEAAGLNTAGFISGYRGSPLGGVDQELWRARKYLEQHKVKFVPGINEDLGATAVWGTQQVGLFPNPTVDGVYAMWYGKGPGVDRSGDVFRHGNAAGTSKHGGVLLIAGDDHAAKSSTLPHQSDHVFDAFMIPVLNPAGVQEFLDFGIHGWAMSRYSGCWVAMKAITDTVESSAIVEVNPQRVQVKLPDDEMFRMPAQGLNIRWPDPPLVVEDRLLHQKVYAAMAYARVNGLNRIVINNPKPRLGIVTSGKSYLDVMQALDDLGIDEKLASDIGLRILKIGMTWPLEPEIVHQFAEGLDEILVIEEKRQVMEYQLKEQLYNWREDVRPRVIGKYDEKGEWVLPAGNWLLPAAGELTPAMVARVIAGRIARFYTSPVIEERLRFLDEKENALKKPREIILRQPYFCSGCPHNTSTKLPEGSVALAGIGCHYMAMWIQPGTKMFTQMGGEGVPWIGISPYTETKHVFANLGDGTYFHSGILAIRASVAAKTNITYKLLYNDAVAMTGGQPVDGTLTVPMITRQLEAEGVNKIIITTDDVEKYGGVSGLAAGVTVHPREELDAIQKELRDTPGVTILIHDQTCAAEKRRRRKRGKFPDPQRRVVINERVCEGCGDCSKQSNCLSVIPVETEYGRKRKIDQSSCNKDFSCLKGYCPSFVTIEGPAKIRKSAQGAKAFAELPDLPAPVMPSLHEPYGILVTGVGGTGVVTIGGVLGMAARLEGIGATTLDQTGLAQKGGAVTSHIRLADHQAKLHAVRIAAGDANAILGCDIVVTATNDCLAKMRKGMTRAVVNSYEAPVGDITKNPDLKFPARSMEQSVMEAVGEENFSMVDATAIATALMGDSIATNMFMLGYAYQKGMVPISEASILRAIELNGAAIEMNKQAFRWGRQTAHDRIYVEKIAFPEIAKAVQRAAETIDDLVKRRMNDLVAYQDDAYAQRYLAFIEKVRAAERRINPESETLSWAVAKHYFKLLAYKDEYEVARLYTDGEFQKQLEQTFEGDYQVHFNLGPTWLQWMAKHGSPRKFSFGPWIMTGFRMLAKMKSLRGGSLDVFGFAEDRKLERRLIGEYEAIINDVLDQLKPENLALAAEIASIPDQIRGYGHIKIATAEAAKRLFEEKLSQFRGVVSKPATQTPPQTVRL
ncbi:indolepyruvate ferredoxin oxidoreductase family protein [Parachitinimonas caeni]|uniref:Indolepyruvate ferredoxin oxidoreductase family protein n=1 Tax=Parachitinimonas caeni TaxID=3031301 RepID=A0ABT7DTB7_9NEIS|nr:indolepyruvate ferredoxin oxidoreductase family protein [Parachitinimonas caeni]MDK2123292.1 indolepyruvate ferredoxin oxidoreductase family protein [Parachitinimonas caeni]